MVTECAQKRRKFNYFIKEAVISRIFRTRLGSPNILSSLQIRRAGSIRGNILSSFNSTFEAIQIIHIFDFICSAIYIGALRPTWMVHMLVCVAMRMTISVIVFGVGMPFFVCMFMFVVMISTIMFMIVSVTRMFVSTMIMVLGAGWIRARFWLRCRCRCRLFCGIFRFRHLNSCCFHCSKHIAS